MERLFSQTKCSRPIPRASGLPRRIRRAARSPLSISNSCAIIWNRSSGTRCLPRLLCLRTSRAGPARNIRKPIEYLRENRYESARSAARRDHRNFRSNWIYGWIRAGRRRVHRIHLRLVFWFLVLQRARDVAARTLDHVGELVQYAGIFRRLPDVPDRRSDDRQAAIEALQMDRIGLARSIARRRVRVITRSTASRDLRRGDHGVHPEASAHVDGRIAGTALRPRRIELVLQACTKRGERGVPRQHVRNPQDVAGRAAKEAKKTGTTQEG